MRRPSSRSGAISPALLAAVLMLVAGLAALYLFVPRPETLPMDEQARAGAGGASVALSDGVVHYQLAGPEGAPAVVLLHGFSTPYLIWDNNFSALAAAGYRVLRYDLYGRGFSDRQAPSSTAGPLRRQLRELIERLSSPPR